MNRRLLLRAGVDLVVAGAVAGLILYLFAVTGQQDSMPPVCTNRFGNTVDCDQGDWAEAAAWVAFGVVSLGLLTVHARRALGSGHD